MSYSDILNSNFDSVELLVHNISHSDLTLSINNLNQTLKRDEAIARPKFSHFREICDYIYSNVNGNDNILPALYPKHVRNMKSNSSADRSNSLSLVINDKNNRIDVNVGFVLPNSSLKLKKVSNLKFRREDINLVQDATSDGCYIDAVYFPLMAILIPKWLSYVSKRNHINKELVVVLISGRGTPTDINTQAKPIDNSTKHLGQLIKLFLSKFYPEIKVKHIHSSINLFRYDENVLFVKRDLIPFIDSYRNVLAAKFRSKWKDAMSVTLSFADGASARVSAIQAALKYYRPMYFHFWQLKTFWCDNIICEDDIECHSYDVIATDPAFSVKVVDDMVKLVIDEMERFRKDFDLTATTKDNDLSSFWMRKTYKPVLAVLLVKKGSEDPKLYRGANMEVSMPTGSLCAERNVIGTALAADFTLKREDLKLIAVYSAPALPTFNMTRSNSIVDMNEEEKTTLSSPSTDSLMIPSSPSIGNKRKIMNFNVAVSPRKSVKSSTSPNTGLNDNAMICTPVNGKRKDVNKTTRLIRNRPLNPINEPIYEITSIHSGSNSQSNSEENIFEDHDNAHDMFQYDSVSVDENDMNPLRPCGACQEWLKKISEVNPQFSVITFTDVNCCGVYIEPIVD